MLSLSQLSSLTGFFLLLCFGIWVIEEISWDFDQFLTLYRRSHCQCFPVIWFFRYKNLGEQILCGWHNWIRGEYLWLDSVLRFIVGWEWDHIFLVHAFANSIWRLVLNEFCLVKSLTCDMVYILAIGQPDSSNNIFYSIVKFKIIVWSNSLFYSPKQLLGLWDWLYFKGRVNSIGYSDDRSFMMCCWFFNDNPTCSSIAILLPFVLHLWTSCFVCSCFMQLFSWFTIYNCLSLADIGVWFIYRPWNQVPANTTNREWHRN